MIDYRFSFSWDDLLINLPSSNSNVRCTPWQGSTRPMEPTMGIFSQWQIINSFVWSHLGLNWIFHLKPLTIIRLLIIVIRLRNQRRCCLIYDVIRIILILIGLSDIGFTHILGRFVSTWKEYKSSNKRRRKIMDTKEFN